MLLSIGALALTFLVPVLGLALGVFAVAACVRAWRALSARQRSIALPVIGLLVSLASLCLAGMVLWVQTYFSGELGGYAECMKGAGTSTSQQACVGQLERAIQHRLPFMPAGSVKIPFPP
ncbi:hypothetical protein Sme01_42870 [Sphaerisporangium melleum]|uniref:DUF4190 domain-containing protein n=1 Tax=Sphaerisporangium melleum TaxID=321316 RepID=A0A917QY83_9ACTN|nr:hypothetical protein GCM10007964_19830 [Sphaerisporangium melleum]GII71811.1 hypothetical protein Sme01_42870 [Sphaerisporangium melleum]